MSEKKLTVHPVTFANSLVVPAGDYVVIPAHEWAEFMKHLQERQWLEANKRYSHPEVKTNIVFKGALDDEE